MFVGPPYSLFLHQDQGDRVTIATPDTAGTPFCRFEDVLLEGGRRATVLRENPAGRELPIGDPKEVGYSCLPWYTPHEGGEGPLQELNPDLGNHCYCMLLAIPMRPAQFFSLFKTSTVSLTAQQFVCLSGHLPTPHFMH